MKPALLIILMSHFNSLLTAQIFQKERLTNEDKKEGIRAVFNCAAFEYSAKLTLINNTTFSYEENSTNRTVVSHGKWIKKNDMILLNSDIDSGNVPVKLFFFNTDTIRTYYESAKDSNIIIPVYKTKFEVPVNLKKIPLPDSRIFVNNDSTYCFPFFDTCIGDVITFNKIKINFGEGFKTRWIKLKNKKFKRILIVAQFDFLFSNYLAFRNQKFKINGRRLIKIN